MLSRYSIEIIREVTEPATGLPGRLKWLPSVAEIREECDILANRIQRKIDRENQIREQLAARETLQLTDQRQRKSYEQIVKECREVGLNIGPKSLQSKLDPEFVRKKMNLTQEQWNAIPDAEHDQAQ